MSGRDLRGARAELVAMRVNFANGIAEDLRPGGIDVARARLVADELAVVHAFRHGAEPLWIRAVGAVERIRAEGDAFLEERQKVQRSHVAARVRKALGREGLRKKLAGDP